VKHQIDLGIAADAEAFGALAARKDCKRSKTTDPDNHFTPAQTRAISAIAGSFLKIAKSAGAGKKRIKFGKITLELRKNRSAQVLSIRKTARSA